MPQCERLLDVHDMIQRGGTMDCFLCAHPVAVVVAPRAGTWQNRNFFGLGVARLYPSRRWGSGSVRWRQAVGRSGIGAGMNRGGGSGVVLCATFQQEAATKLQDSDAFPILRSYENDLCRLEMMGDATAGEAIAALASDGGRTAEEELANGKSLMTIDVTVSGSVGERNTVSTRILAPTKQVAERARAERGRRKGRKTGDGVFRSLEFVLMRHVLRFELQLRRPGYVREVGKEKGDVETVARLVSMDAKVLEDLAGAVASHAVALVTKYSRARTERVKWNPLFWTKEKWSPGAEAAVRVRMLSTAEISVQVKRLREECPSPAKQGEWDTVRESHTWWPLRLGSKPAMLQEGDLWVSEYVPVHMLQIDLERVQVEVEGSHTVREGRVCTILLTHAQIVELANVLDCYYDDGFTVPAKKLVTRTDLRVPFSSRSRLVLAVSMAVVATVVGAAVLVGCLVAARLRGVDVSRVDGSAMSSTAAPLISRDNRPSTRRKPFLPINDELVGKEMEVLCRVVVAMVKDGEGWSEEIESRAGEGAWMGLDLTKWEKPDSGGVEQEEPPSQLVDTNVPATEENVNYGGSENVNYGGSENVNYGGSENVNDGGSENVNYGGSENVNYGGSENVNDGGSETVPCDVSSQPSTSANETSSGFISGTSEAKDTANSVIAGNMSLPCDWQNPAIREKVLAYQVVLSRDGKVIGFSPQNTAAIQKWAQSPLTEALHSGKRIRVSLFERVPKYTGPPQDAVVIELLYLDDEIASSVTARPFKL